MKIAFDHQIFSMQEYGGISRYFVELTRELNLLQDTEVTVAAPLYINQYLRQAAKNIVTTGFSLKKFKGSGLLLPPINSFINSSVLKSTRSDIVHETYYSFQRCAPKSAKVVLTVFDMIHELFPEYFSASDPTSRMKAAAVARADHIICISHQTQSDLINLLQVDPAKTTVIHLGFKLTVQQPQQCVWSNGSPFLLYVGSRSGYKNFEIFLRAFSLSSALLKKYRIFCFGGGPFSTREFELIKSLGFSENCVCQLAGSDAVLASLYKEAHAFVYPSLYEGFGIPPLEAMSFGCPVICSNTSSIPEVIGDAGLYFNPLNTTEIKNVIESVSTNETLRSSLIAAGYKRIQNFSWEQCAAETFKVYQKVLA